MSVVYPAGKIVKVVATQTPPRHETFWEAWGNSITLFSQGLLIQLWEKQQFHFDRGLKRSRTADSPLGESICKYSHRPTSSSSVIARPQVGPMFNSIRLYVNKQECTLNIHIYEYT